MSVDITKLGSGLNVISQYMPNSCSVAISLVIKTGSRYEEEEEHGISHFLEHMLFQGTTNRSSKKIAEEFDWIGGSFNAYTSKEYTVYYAKILPKDLELALDIISDIVHNSVFQEKSIQKEFQVICQEIAQEADNPDDLAYEKLYEHSFIDQPIGRSILGTKKSISNFDYDMLSNYLKKHYVTDKMCLSVAGNVSHDEVVKHAEKLFSPTIGLSKPAKKAIYKAGFSVIDKPTLEQSTIVLGFKSTSYTDLDQFYYTQILCLILGGGISSRLFQSVREEKGLVYSIGSFNNSFDDTGLLSICASTTHAQIEAVISGIGEEIAQICEKVQDYELARAKSQIEASLLMLGEKTAYKSEDLGKNYSVFNRHISVAEILEKVHNTTTNDIVDSAKLIFSCNPGVSIVGAELSNIDFHQINKLLKN